MRMRKSAVLLILSSLFPGVSAAQIAHDHRAPENLGTVSFAISCHSGVQREFEKGVALLHSFAYSSAEGSFNHVAEKDPHCAIAHWGIAMTYYHELWNPPIQQDTFSKGRAEIRRSQIIGGGTALERGYIRALSLFYKGDFSAMPFQERVALYERAMGGLAEAHPEDSESQVFYALALLAGASPFDKTHARQKHAAQILLPLFFKYPQHPGIAHYLIHACDNQEMARQGLDAALAYSKIASSTPHALHMPSHIFTRLGMWNESIASNQLARVAARGQGDIGEELHAMDYLVYAYLQQGRDREANDVIQQSKAMPNLDEQDFKIAYAATAMPARYAIERRQWTEAVNVVSPVDSPPNVIAVAIWARGMGLARSGQPALARLEVERLRQLEPIVRSPRESNGDYWGRQLKIQESEVMAWTTQAEGDVVNARSLLRKAADEEDAMEKLPVTPGPIVPAREQLGDLLLQQGRPQLALKEFQISLKAYPNRRGSVKGVSEASARLRTHPTQK